MFLFLGIQFICDVCDMKFNTKHMIKKHILSHAIRIEKTESRKAIKRMTDFKIKLVQYYLT